MALEQIYWDYFLQPEGEDAIAFQKRLFYKIQEKTGLDALLIPVYEIFVDNASIPEGIIMYDDVKHKMIQRASKAMGMEYCSELKPSIDKAYENILKTFKGNGLMIQHSTLTGAKYPKLIGYNYFDDPEFYIAYRKLGNKEWNGRLSISNANVYELCKLLETGNEIREKDVLRTILN